MLDAGNPEILTHFIKWASTIASVVSNPSTQAQQIQPGEEATIPAEEEPAVLPNNIPLPDVDDLDVADVW